MKKISTILMNKHSNNKYLLLPMLLATVMLGFVACGKTDDGAANNAAVDESVEYRLVKVASIDGDVNLLRSSDEGLEIFSGMQLIPDDNVTTGAGALTELLVDSDKHIGAGENTSFTVNATGTEENGKVTINLEYGTALFTIDNKLPDGSSFEVNTPNASLSVRGTTFEVTYDAETEETTVKVEEGAVWVTNNDDNSDEDVILEAGDNAVITAEAISIEGESLYAFADDTLFLTSFNTNSKTTTISYYTDGSIAGINGCTLTEKDGLIYFDRFVYGDSIEALMSHFDVVPLAGAGTSYNNTEVCTNDGEHYHLEIREYDQYGFVISEETDCTEGDRYKGGIDWSYEFDEYGNVVKGTGVVTALESAHPLDSVIEPILTTEYTYEYDENGNIIAGTYHNRGEYPNYDFEPYESSWSFTCEYTMAKDMEFVEMQ